MNLQPKRLIIIAAVVALLLGVDGCGDYVSAPKRYSELGNPVRIDLPEGWLQYTKAKNGFTITRDGLRLERITIRSFKIGEKLKETERCFSVGMMPHEAADLSIGLIKAHSDMNNFEVQSIDAVQFAGKDGYRVDATYVDEGGLQKRVQIHGAILGNYVCELVYDAIEPVYFMKYQCSYDKVVSSARMER